MPRIAVLGAAVLTVVVLNPRPGAAQTTPAGKIAAARKLIVAGSVDSATTLLHQVADSPSTAGPQDRAAAFVWLGIAAFYRGDDSTTARNFRAALAIDPSTDAANLAGIDTLLAAAWQREQVRSPNPYPLYNSSTDSQPTVVRAPRLQPTESRVHDCVHHCKGGESAPRLISLPQMHFENRGTLGPSGSHGHVVVQGVVDQAGRLDPGTISLITSNAPEFERAVREVLPALQFRPARLLGVPVAVRIELRFDIRPEGAGMVRYSVETP